MPNISSNTLPPTRKQLAYLRKLAQRAGQTFTTRRTRFQASTEIRRLQAIRSTGFTFAELEAEPRRPRAQRRPHLLRQTGRGLGIRVERDLEPAIMTATTVTDTRTGEPTVGEPRELARYTVPGGERVLLGQRIDGIVVVTDYALAGGERAYLVEQTLTRGRPAHGYRRRPPTFPGQQMR